MSLQPLESALRKRLDVVADHSFRDRDPNAHLQAIKAAHEELERQIVMLPSDTDPQLLHFLERQSYPKALAFLENQS